MMESQNRKRAPAWTELEVRDLIAVWEEESVLSELHSSFQNAKTFVKISQGMKDRGHNWDPKQCRVKLKELRQAYQKTREANNCSRSEPQTCHFYDELHAILGGSATTTPGVLFDSLNGDGGNTEAGFGDEEDDDDEVVDSSQQASGETGFPDSQELFLTLDLEPVPPEPTQGCLLDLPGGEGTSKKGKSHVRIRNPGILRKGDHKFTAPLKTIEKKGPYTYRLSDEGVWNASYLAPAYAPTGDYANTQSALDDFTVVPTQQEIALEPGLERRTVRPRRPPVWTRDYVM
ncbi:hypothetical protein UY3_11065 [Chelonia mydas]|uniref:Myb/SANT-like DNA-binding domain-containing protein n=1 Tax=Chelonia mydas TaxID=8469 RepID=M7B1Q3_CHEMY|nr:hypothetical protein UY3_11065 [Chelonia mydas]